MIDGRSDACQYDGNSWNEKKNGNSGYIKYIRKNNDLFNVIDLFHQNGYRILTAKCKYVINSDR